MSSQEFTDAVEEVVRSGALGRSAAYVKLLRFLGEQSGEGVAPKELDIAVEVFDRNEGFDPAQDSMVRVYVHNLRQKLDAYYEGRGDTQAPRLIIPKGQYRLLLEQPPAPTAASTLSSHRPAIMLAATALFALAAGWWLGSMSDDRAPTDVDFTTAPAWAAILDDDLPVTIVSGDYFMFAELDDTGMPARLIRDFQVNSSADLRRLRRSEPELATEYGDLDLTYLPIGAGPAIADLTVALAGSGKSVNVVPASRFQFENLRDSHVIYVGYLSGLGQLAQFVFAGSGVSIGMSYDELVVIETGEEYVSEAGLAADGETHYLDYGYVATFPGPSEGMFLVVAGTRDEGLMQSARYLTTAEGLEDIASMQSSGISERAFEVLLEVSGFDRSNLDAERIHAGEVDAQAIWLPD